MSDEELARFNYAIDACAITMHFTEKGVWRCHVAERRSGQLWSENHNTSVKQLPYVHDVLSWLFEELSDRFAYSVDPPTRLQLDGQLHMEL